MATASMGPGRETPNISGFDSATLDDPAGYRFLGAGLTCRRSRNYRVTAKASIPRDLRHGDAELSLGCAAVSRSGDP